MSLKYDRWTLVSLLFVNVNEQMSVGAKQNLLEIPNRQAQRGRDGRVT